MSSLAGKTLLSTYTSLLKLEGDTQTLVAGGGTAIQIKTGDNEVTPIYLNTNRVGIGTASPDSTLHVKSSDGVTYHDSSSVGQSNNLIFRDSGETWMGQIEFATTSSAVYTRNTSSLRLGSNNSAAITIINGGNVGIGIATPQTSLDIYKSTATVSASTNDIVEYGLYIRNHNVTTNAFAGICFDVSTTTENQDAYGAAIQCIRDTAAGSSTDVHKANLAFFTNSDKDDNSYERMRIMHTGNVGIGTATPDFHLEVANTGSDCLAGLTTYDDRQTMYSQLHIRTADNTEVSPAAVDADDRIGDITFMGHNGSAFQAGATIRATADENWSGSGHGTNLTFHTVDNTTTSIDERMRIDHNGNVGIGTDDPLKRLHVRFDTSTTEYPLMITNTYSTVGARTGILFQVADQEASIEIERGAANQGTDMRFLLAQPDSDTKLERLTILESGKVGIGSDAPKSLLEVRGADAIGVITISRKDADNSMTTGHEISRLEFSGYEESTPLYAVGAKIVARASGNWALSTNLNYSGTDLEFYTQDAQTDDNSMTVPRMVIDSIGRVGIGTTSPISAFEVEAGLTTTGAVLTLGTKETTVDANDVLGRINFYAPLEGSGTVANLVGASIAAVAQRSFTDAINSTALSFQTGDSGSAATRMVIDETGYVGIGTDSPSHMLTVGNITANQATYICIQADTGDNAGVVIREEGVDMWKVQNVPSASNQLQIVDASGDGVTLAQDSTATPGWAGTSDLNLKTDISVLSDALTKVNKIRGVNFKWKKYKDDGANPNAERDINRIGVIAQEVNEVLPEAVDSSQEGEWGVVYTGLIPLLIEAIKELSAEVEKLKKS